MTPQEAIKHLLESGVTKAQLCRDTKTSKTQIDNYESGKTKTMSETKAQRFYEAYGIEIEGTYPL